MDINICESSKTTNGRQRLIVVSTNSTANNIPPFAYMMHLILRRYIIQQKSIYLLCSFCAGSLSWPTKILRPKNRKEVHKIIRMSKDSKVSKIIKS